MRQPHRSVNDSDESPVEAHDENDEIESYGEEQTQLKPLDYFSCQADELHVMLANVQIFKIFPINVFGIVLYVNGQQFDEERECVVTS